MATWVVHLRMADYFIDMIKGINPAEFTVGSVAPDCGYGKKDSVGDFVPPPTVTHWTSTGSKKDCRYKDFYTEYLKDKEKNDAYWFYLGYYVHLLTDIMWSSRIYLPTCDKYESEFVHSSGFLQQIKRDWNDLDHKYIRDNPDFRAFEILSKTETVKDYLPYYEKSQLTVQINYISKYYKENFNKPDLDREYVYLTENEIDSFIKAASEVIKIDLDKKNLI